MIKRFFFGFLFLVNIYIFLSSILFLVKNFIFGQNFYFWSKFLFLVKIFTFGQNFYFLSKFLFFGQIFIFGQNCDFFRFFSIDFFTDYFKPWSETLTLASIPSSSASVALFATSSARASKNASSVSLWISVHQGWSWIFPFPLYPSIHRHM